jgi:hypothetical protein
MPTLEVPNLAKLQLDQIASPPPIARPGPWIPITAAGNPVNGSSQSQTQPQGCTPPGLNLCVYQGATLTSTIKLTLTDINGVVQPVNITGNLFQFTAKLNTSLPDTDPTVVKVDWTETNTPTQGITALVVPANITATMQLVPYFYQVWMIGSPTSPSPIVTPLFNGTLTVLQPVSSRD